MYQWTNGPQFETETAILWLFLFRTGWQASLLPKKLACNKGNDDK